MVNIVKYAWLEIDDLKLLIHPAVYPPSEDTFALLQVLESELKKDKLSRGLELGCGCGILTVYMARSLDEVIAVDINPYAVRCTLLNAYLNGVSRKVKVFRGNLFSPIKRGDKFDLIVFNSPYLPPEKAHIDDIHGGLPLIARFLKMAKSYLTSQGRIIFTCSTLTPETKVMILLTDLRYRYEVVAVCDLFMERLFIIKAFPYPRL